MYRTGRNCARSAPTVSGWTVTAATNSSACPVPVNISIRVGKEFSGRRARTSAWRGRHGVAVARMITASMADCISGRPAAGRERAARRCAWMSIRKAGLVVNATTKFSCQSRLLGTRADAATISALAPMGRCGCWEQQSGAGRLLHLQLGPQRLDQGRGFRGAASTCGPEGVPWVINHQGRKSTALENGLWRRISGRRKDIGIGADGSGMGHRLRRIAPAAMASTVTKRQRLGQGHGSPSQISVGPDGDPWVVKRGRLYLPAVSGFESQAAPGHQFQSLWIGCLCVIFNVTYTVMKIP